MKNPVSRFILILTFAVSAVSCASSVSAPHQHPQNDYSTSTLLYKQHGCSWAR